jgi:hypothetical protein
MVFCWVKEASWGQVWKGACNNVNWCEQNLTKLCHRFQATGRWLGKWKNKARRLHHSLGSWNLWWSWHRHINVYIPLLIVPPPFFFELPPIVFGDKYSRVQMIACSRRSLRCRGPTCRVRPTESGSQGQAGRKRYPRKAEPIRPAHATPCSIDHVSLLRSHMYVINHVPLHHSSNKRCASSFMHSPRAAK